MKTFNISKEYLIEKYIKQNKSTKEISRIIGCCKDVIVYNLKKYCIPFKFRIGIKLSEEHKKKISKSHIGLKPKFTKIWRRRLSKSLKGRKLTEEWKQKISNSHKGLKQSKSHIRKRMKKLNKLRKINPKFNITKNVKHHIFLKENSNKIIKISRKQHRQLHARAYDFIYYKYGEKGINSFLSWFFKKYTIKK